MSSRVFIVHEPLSRDGHHLRDLRPARKFGPLVHLTPPGPYQGPIHDLLPEMKKALNSFTANDFLLPMGHPVLIGWAAAIAAERSGGKVTILYWTQERDYIAISSELF